MRSNELDVQKASGTRLDKKNIHVYLVSQQ